MLKLKFLNAVLRICPLKKNKSLTTGSGEHDV